MGTELLRRATGTGLVLINEQGAKTRTTPNIKQQDTTPDLTWTDSRTARKTEWKVFEDTWGSDHHPIETSILGKTKRRKKKRTVKTTVWDDFRAALEESTGTTFDDLTKLMREAAKAATVETLVEIGAPIPDTRLLSLWRKRTNYLRRYRRTRKKRDIRKANSAPLPETTIQRAPDVVSDFLTESGLRPSPEKTRYMAFGKEWNKVDADLRFNGQQIEKATEHSILGVNIHSGGDPTIWIQRMRTTWKKGLLIVRRLATRVGGLGERLARTVVQAALVSKISYGLRFYKLNATQRAELEILMNDARRCISGLPKCTRLELLHEAVPMLSLEELERHQEWMYAAKLTHTRQGRAIAELMPSWNSLCATTTPPPIPDPIPPWQKTTVTPAWPIPRRMNSATNIDRRRKFARQHEQKNGGDDELYAYVDAAFKDGVAATAAWHYEKTTKSTELQRCGSAQEAEVRAVLEAIKDAAATSSDKFRTLRVFTNSQATVRVLRTQVMAHGAVGEIFRLAQNLERRDLNPLTIRVEWIPGHAGIAGNERAHRAAIEELNRIDLRRQDPGPAPSVEPPPPAFNLYDTEGTILNIKLAYKKIEQTKLNARGEPPEASIPSGTFRRHAPSDGSERPVRGSRNSPTLKRQ
ncbi:hypothetical protein HPB47_009061 [Ixodes persulcatus]|uniref:Uncharacterized protein n=1 Tax=Ixodes persulcatus TaxID=34615 RepID=A0AC60P3C8_IXOPE|nr:hypothetical protein HPB47_009061 [Ixodes persulcatus]